MFRQLCAFLCVVLISLPAIGQSNNAQKRKSLLLLKVLTFDYFLARRHKADIKIGVLYLSSDERAAKQAAQSHRLMSNLKMTVAGRRVSTRLLRYSAFLKGKGSKIGTIVVCDGFKRAQLKEVVTHARKSKVLTIAFSRAYVEQGVAAATVLENDRIKILVNPQAAADQGSKFARRLLRLAEVINR